MHWFDLNLGQYYLAAMEKERSWDEVLEKWGGNYEKKENWRKVYNAGREVNKKVAIKTWLSLSV